MLKFTILGSNNLKENTPCHAIVTTKRSKHRDAFLVEIANPKSFREMLENVDKKYQRGERVAVLMKPAITPLDDKNVTLTQTSQ